MKYTKTVLQKLETLFEEQSYKVRYEKGSFQSGFCLVEAKKIIVINRFFETDGRINVLLDILSRTEIDNEKMSETSEKLYKEVFKP